MAADIRAHLRHPIGRSGDFAHQLPQLSLHAGHIGQQAIAVTSLHRHRHIQLAGSDALDDVHSDRRLAAQLAQHAAHDVAAQTSQQQQDHANLQRQVEQRFVIGGRHIVQINACAQHPAPAGGGHQIGDLGLRRVKTRLVPYISGIALAASCAQGLVEQLAHVLAAPLLDPMQIFADQSRLHPVCDVGQALVEGEEILALVVAHAAQGRRRQLLGLRLAHLAVRRHLLVRRHQRRCGLHQIARLVLAVLQHGVPLSHHREHTYRRHQQRHRH